MRAKPESTGAWLVRAGLAACLAAVSVAAAPAAPTPAPTCMASDATVPITADAKVTAKRPRAHYGRRDRWKVSYRRARARSYIDFDLPPVPLGCSVGKAIVRLAGSYSGRPHDPNGWPGASVEVGLVRRGWGERNVTWRNMPAVSGCNGSLDYARPDSWQITAAIQHAYACLDDGRLAAWHGLRLRGWSPQGRGARWRLAVDSRESARPPVVQISWE